MTGILATIDALRSEVDTLRAQAATMAREHAILTEHADALEGALSTIAGAVGASWDDGVREDTARVLAAITARHERWRTAMRGVVDAMRDAEQLHQQLADCALSDMEHNQQTGKTEAYDHATNLLTRAIERMTDDQPRTPRRVAG